MGNQTSELKIIRDRAAQVAVAICGWKSNDIVSVCIEEDGTVSVEFSRDDCCNETEYNYIYLTAVEMWQPLEETIAQREKILEEEIAVRKKLIAEAEADQKKSQEEYEFNLYQTLKTKFEKPN
jgi:hypothetical protein